MPRGWPWIAVQFRFRPQLQPAQMNQYQQHDYPCCILETSAISRNKSVQNHLAFTTVQAGLTAPARRILGTASMPHQMFFGCFDVFHGAGLEPLAVMRQADKTVLLERLVPEDFDCEFSGRSIQ